VIGGRDLPELHLMC